jgi:crotonobetainyl-CoA:carnitine CoA-transferase CaiB-like acyl-CoA transferase
VTTDQAAGPLAGVRVIELATTVMAPYGVQLLGDLGAEVIKVEGPEGDPNRSMGGGGHPELSGVALNLHRNKRSIAVDLKQARGHDIMLRLMAGADVLVTNMRLSALKRLGLDYDSIETAAPQLIYVEAHGFRVDSGLAEAPSYDDTIQAQTGLPMLGEAVGTGVFFLPTLIADKVAGMHITQGVLAALYHRAVTGQGQRVEIPMFDSVLSFVLTEHIGRAAFPGGPAGYSRILTANRGPHQTSDGWLALMPYLDRHWRGLFEAVGCADLLNSPWHRDMPSRLREADTVYGELKTVIRKQSTAYWLELCRRIDVPVAEIHTLDEIVADESLHHGVLAETEHPVAGRYRNISPPAVYYQSPTSRLPRPAPLIGADGEQILADLGYKEPEIAAMMDDGVVRRPGGE